MASHDPATVSDENEGQRPALRDLRVLELGSLIAGPYASALLAQFGAQVVKIEVPGAGDPLRKWRKLHDGTSLWWYVQSRNKKSVALDIKSEEGREIILDLVRETDIVIENFRPGTLEKWGLGWKDLSAVNPRLVMVRVSGYGQSGPYRDQPGFAAIAEAMGGLRYVTGSPDRPPARSGVSIGDTLAGLYAALGALMAVYETKLNGGEGQYVDVALYEAVFAVMESLVPEYDSQKFVRQRSGGSLPGISPSNTYPCGDGKHVVIAGNGDSLFRRLMIAIGRDDLSRDPTLAHNDGRVLRNAELDEAIAKWTQQHTIDEVESVLNAAEVPVGKIYSAADIFHDPHYAARDMIERHNLPDGTTLAIPGIVPKLSRTPGRTKWLGPALGQHSGEVLQSIGRTEKEIAELLRRGIIGDDAAGTE